MESKTVYVVTDGEYSDYHIKGVFSTKENAEMFVAVPECGGEIEEWPLDGPTDAIKEHLWPFLIRMKKDGSVDLIYKQDFDYGYRNASEGVRYLSRWDMMVVTVMARDEQHAIKIANEKRTQLIALNQWEVPPHG